MNAIIMSSYLSFYIVPKRKTQKESKKYIIIASYSRSTELYQYFDEHIHPVYCGSDIRYTPLSSEDVSSVLADFNDDISKAQARLTEYEKYVKDNPEYIDEIISTKEYIQDLQYWRDKATFIEDMLSDMPCYEEIEEICCNIG